MTFWGVRARGRYWGQSGHELLRRTRPLMTQSGHDPSRYQDTSRRDPLALGPTNVGGMGSVAYSSLLLGNSSTYGEGMKHGGHVRDL